jgi:ribonuclease HI
MASQLKDWDIFEDAEAPEGFAAAAPIAKAPARKRRARAQDSEKGSAPADPQLRALEREADAEAQEAEARAAAASASSVSSASSPPPAEPGVARIYTDGSCVGNGKAGCFAGIGVFFGPDDPRNVSWPLTKGKPSNQNAELQALSIATEEGDRMLREGEVSKVMIHTDSQYGIHCATTWYRTWLRNGWVNTAGKPVAHREWIEPIANRLAMWGDRLQLVKIKAHVGMWGNEQADELARSAAERARNAWAKKVASSPELQEHAVVYPNPSQRPRIKPKFTHTQVQLGSKLVDIVDPSAHSI